MLLKENFTKEHIDNLRSESNRDPILLERTIFAFGMLEALRKVDMPFIFKGGTSLILLLDYPQRLSTDIDIVVQPGTDVKKYIEEASKIFPFLNQEEQIRKGKNNIEKRHFKFTYYSPVRNTEFYILLDILFEENNYPTLTEKEIKNSLLLSEGESLKVKIPNLNCILGDKLTAFAPHTTGIPLRKEKDLEVIKQMYDICSLIPKMDNLNEVKESYERVAKAEIDYRGGKYSLDECLIDTIKTGVCIASRGKILREDYPFLMDGSRQIQNFIFSEKFTPEKATDRVPLLISFASALLENQPFKLYNGETINEWKFKHKGLNTVNHLRKRTPEGYFYAVNADIMLRESITFEP